MIAEKQQSRKCTIKHGHTHFTGTLLSALAYLCANAIKFLQIPSGHFDNNIIKAGFKTGCGGVGHGVLEIR
jgi:hypothetical protein